MITRYRYRLPMRGAFTAAGVVRREREGLILRYRRGEIDLACEAAPLVGFSAESLQDVIELSANPSLQEEFDRFARTLRTPGEIISFLDRPLPPSLRFALSALSLQLLEMRDLETVSKQLSPPPGRKLAINGVTGELPPDETAGIVDRLAREGYGTIKLKSSTGARHALEVIGRVEPQWPGLRWRIDANGSWPPDSAQQQLQLLARPSIDYCEEPCRFDSLREAAAFRKEAPVAIALDESLGSIERLREAMQEGASDVMVLKPTLLGNLVELAETCSTPEAGGFVRVVTTALESAVGRMAVTRAAWLCGSTGTAHGLDTGRLLRTDLIAEKHAPERSSDSLPPWCPGFRQLDPKLLTPLDS